MISEAFVTELNQKLLTFGLVSFLSGAKSNNKLDLILTDRRLKFDLKGVLYKSRITLNLGIVHAKASFSTTRNNFLNIGLLCTKKNKSSGEKRAMFQEIIKTVHVLGLQNFINYERMNPVEITLDSNEIVEDLSKYKRSKYRFVIESLLFSSNLQNDTDVIFITCNGLSDAREAPINSKLYKTLGVVYLSQIKIAIL